MPPVSDSHPRCVQSDDEICPYWHLRRHPDFLKYLGVYVPGRSFGRRKAEPGPWWCFLHCLGGMPRGDELLGAGVRSALRVAAALSRAGCRGGGECMPGGGLSSHPCPIPGRMWQLDAAQSGGQPRGEGGRGPPMGGGGGASAQGRGQAGCWCRSYCPQELWETCWLWKGTGVHHPERGRSRARVPSRGLPSRVLWQPRRPPGPRPQPGGR